MDDLNSEALERQADEIEALSSIYGDEWCVLDPASRLFCIKVTDGQNPAIWKLNLHVHMPEDYPLTTPPEYQINAGWLRGDERIHVQNKLDDIYCENIGEDLVFIWVEALREFLQNKADAGDQSLGSSSADGVHKSEEQEEAEDAFDVSQLGEFLYEKFEPVETSSLSTACPDIVHGVTLTDRKSTFQPHLAVVTRKEQINQVLSRLYENKKIANATHNILAYRILTGDGVVYQGCEDDGETHAGSRMLHLLQIMNADNVMVVVSRWYGGILLGPDRFKHINNCTRQILEQNGFMREKEEKRGPRSGKKTR